MKYNFYKLGDICSMVKGESPTMKTLEGKYPLVVTAAYRRTANTYQIDGEAVCIPLVSSTGHGDAAIHRVHYQNGKFALANLLVALLPKDPSICNAKYLYHLLMTKKDEYLVSLMRGTANVSLKEQDIYNVEISLPPVEEQRRIVERIEELAGKVAEARGLRERSIEECGLLLKSSVKAIIYNESKRQNLKPLKDLVTIKGGGTPSKQNPMFWKGSIPWISAKDIKKREFYNSIDYISEDALNNSSAKMIEAGAVVVVTRGMILAHTFPSTILRISATINQDLKALIPNKEISSEYLSHVLWALNDSILELVEKSTHDTRKLETSKLLNFEIPVPHLSEQQRIVTYLDEVQAKLDTVKRLRQEALRELEALLPAILDKAFKGEL